MANSCVNNIYNLLDNITMNFKDSIVWPCHKIELLPHISEDLQGNFLIHSNKVNLY